MRAGAAELHMKSRAQDEAAMSWEPNELQKIAESDDAHGNHARAAEEATCVNLKSAII